MGEKERERDGGMEGGRPSHGASLSSPSNPPSLPASLAGAHLTCLPGGWVAMVAEIGCESLLGP